MRFCNSLMLLLLNFLLIVLNSFQTVCNHCCYVAAYSFMLQAMEFGLIDGILETEY
uniref:Uncharacterized protein n=1 Tax=Rhizophora mucronata TaxID=61149 RepID=A0A2P2JNF3_RHIMU